MHVYKKCIQTNKPDDTCIKTTFSDLIRQMQVYSTLICPVGKIRFLLASDLLPTVTSLYGEGIEGVTQLKNKLGIKEAKENSSKQ